MAPHDMKSNGGREKRPGISPLALIAGYSVVAALPLLLAALTEKPVGVWAETASALGIVAAVMLFLQLLL